MASGMSNGILANSPYYRYNAWFVGILVVLTIISNLIFLPLMGMTGAALASMLSMLLYSLVKFGFLYKKFGYQPYDYRFVQIILFGVITFAAVSLIPASDNLYFNIILVSGLTTVLFTGMLYAGKTLPEVNQFMQRLLSKRNKN